MQADRAKFLAARKKGIGGSDSPKVLGFSPWGDALTVYMDKVGLTDDGEDNDTLHFGRTDEQGIVELFQKRTGLVVQTGLPMLQSAKYPYLIGHTDGRIEGNGTGFEAKSVSPFAAKEFGDDGSDEVPAMYNIQVQHYMACDGTLTKFIMAVRANNRLRIYHIPRSEQIIKQIVDADGTLWNDHVLKEVPPDTDNPKFKKQLLDAVFPTDSGTTIEADEELAELVRLRLNAKAELESRVLSLDNQIKERIGDAKKVTHPEFSISWSTVKGRQTVNWKAVAAKANIPLAIISENTTTGDPYRRFVITPAKGGDDE